MGLEVNSFLTVVVIKNEAFMPLLSHRRNKRDALSSELLMAMLKLALKSTSNVDTERRLTRPKAG